MYKNEIATIQGLVREAVELEFHEKRNDGKNLFKVTSIDGEALVDDDVVLVGLKTDSGPLMVGSPANRVYGKLEFSNYIGKLEVYYCKKKKGMFGKESLKTIHSLAQTFHHSELESGEEVPVSIRTVLKK